MQRPVERVKVKERVHVHPCSYCSILEMFDNSKMKGRVRFSRVWSVRFALLFVPLGSLTQLIGWRTACFAQTNQPLPIRVETSEVILPVEVAEERKDPKGLLVGPDGKQLPVYIQHSEEIRGLSAKSFHIFEDGLEQEIKHFSFEANFGWAVNDNVGHHVEYSCTPAGIWGGQDQEKIEGMVERSPEEFEHDKLREFHTYLLTYVPRPSPEGSCHRVVVKVDRKHATVFAPNQYCNTAEPLSDPLKTTDIGNGLLLDANSLQPSSLPLSIQTIVFAGSSPHSYRLNIAAALPTNLLNRHWEGAHLETSIAVLGLVYNKDNVVVSRFSDVACLPPKSNIGYNGPLPPNERNIPPLIVQTRRIWENVTMPTSYQTQLEVSPGDYRLVVAITDGKRFGRTTAAVTVADLTPGELNISDIALCTRYHKPLSDDRGPTRAPRFAALMFDNQEFTPAGDAHFKRGEPLMNYLEIYTNSQPDTAAPAEIFLEMKVWDTRTGELKISTGVRRVESATARRGSTIPVVWTLAVDKLPTGSYRTEAQASDSEGHKTDWRKASFTVD
jgi:hypothetical protein